MLNKSVSNSDEKKKLEINNGIYVSMFSNRSSAVQIKHVKNQIFASKTSDPVSHVIKNNNIKTHFPLQAVKLNDRSYMSNSHYSRNEEQQYSQDEIQNKDLVISEMIQQPNVQDQQDLQKSKTQIPKRKIFDLNQNLLMSPIKKELAQSPTIYQPEQYQQKQHNFIDQEIIIGDQPKQPQSLDQSKAVSIRATYINEDLEELPPEYYEMNLDQSTIKLEQNNQVEQTNYFQDKQNSQLSIPIKGKSVNISIQHSLQSKKDGIIHSKIDLETQSAIMDINKQLYTLNNQLSTDMDHANQNHQFHTKQFPNLLRQCHTSTQTMIDTLNHQVMQHQMSVSVSLFGNFAQVLPEQENNLIESYMQQLLKLAKIKCDILIKRNSQSRSHRQFCDMVNKNFSELDIVQTQSFFNQAQAQNIPREQWNQWLQLQIKKQ